MNPALYRPVGIPFVKVTQIDGRCPLHPLFLLQALLFFFGGHRQYGDWGEVEEDLLG